MKNFLVSSVMAVSRAAARLFPSCQAERQVKLAGGVIWSTARSAVTSSCRMVLVVADSLLASVTVIVPAGDAFDAVLPP